MAKRTGDDPDQSRTNDGQYAHKVRCDACGKSVNFHDFVTDAEACDNSDGPGFYLCARPACERTRDLPLADRKALYALQRALNDAADRKLPKKKAPAKPEVSSAAAAYTVGTPVVAMTGSIAGVHGVVVGHNGQRVTVQYEGIGKMATFPRNIARRP